MLCMHMLFCLFLIGLGCAIVLAPLLRYVDSGWEAKRNDIMSSFDVNAMRAYFTAFARDEDMTKADEGEVVKAFHDMHNQWFGRHYYSMPGTLLGLATLVSVACLVFTIAAHFGFLSTNPLIPLPDTALAAYAGAYMWVVNDFTSRARRLDFAPSDVHWGTLRLVISIPMGYAFSRIDKEHGLPIAFALGAFPLEAITTILRRLTFKWLGLEESPESADDISKLQGVNRDVLERLGKEDITTVTQLAYCDPVRLTMRSNLGFDFITDCMGQALAWMYLGKGLDDARPRSLRGAVEAYHIRAGLHSGDATARTDAEKIVADIASKLGIADASLRMVLNQIAEDPYTSFLLNVWNDPLAEDEEEEERAGEYGVWWD
jgi:hypothetical protein